MDAAQVDRRAVSDRTSNELLVDLSYWAWGGRGVRGVDETLRDIQKTQADFANVVATTAAEQKRRDRLLGLAILGGVILANPLTAHLAEPWLKALGH